jgi:hypothetical protein
MAGTNTPIFPQTLTSKTIQFAPGDTTTEKTLITAGSVGTKVQSILAVSTDTSNRDIQLYISVGGTDLLIGTIQIPLGAGNTNSVPTINLLASAQIPWNTDAQGNKFIYLPATGLLRAAMGTTITAAKVVNLFCMCEDF